MRALAKFDIVDGIGDPGALAGLFFIISTLVVAWLLHKPGVVSPIVGATKMNHLVEAVAALDIEMSEEDMASLEELYQPHPVLGHR